MSLRDLYQEIIVDHGRRPRNFGVLTDANHHQHGHNPLCGDKLVISIREKNGVVEEINFEGNGCAISVASASLMTETVKGKSIHEVEKIFGLFHELVTTGKEPAESIGKLSVFSGVAEFPVRVKCATLAWHTLMSALTDDNKPVSTE